MQMHPEALRRLTNFLGYGQPNRSIWFLGMEEAATGTTRLSLGATLPPIADLRQAHINCLKIPKHHLGKRNIQPTWRPMCQLMLRLNGRPATREAIRKYQAENLGRLRGTTFLAELLPIPKPTFDSWPYASIYPQWPTLNDYHRAMLPRRKNILKIAIGKYNPNVIIAYGKRFWPYYTEILGGKGFRKSGPFLVRLNPRKSVSAILVPHMASRQMNGQINRLLCEVRKILRLRARSSGPQT